MKASQPGALIFPAPVLSHFPAHCYVRAKHLNYAPRSIKIHHPR
jgi:hypothetical protein